MAFERHRTSGQRNINFEVWPVTNGHTINPGDAVRLVNGRVRLALTNNLVAGVCCSAAAVTGDAAGTEVVMVDINSQNFYMTDRPAAMNTNTVQAGMLVDIAATGDTIAVDANHDCVVRAYHEETDQVEVQFRNPLFH